MKCGNSRPRKRWDWRLAFPRRVARGFKSAGSRRGGKPCGRSRVGRNSVQADQQGSVILNAFQ